MCSTPAHNEQGPLPVCWIHKTTGTCKSHLRFQETNVCVPVPRSSSEGRGGHRGAVGTAQVLPQLCPLPTNIWLCIPYPAGGMAALGCGSSPVPGHSRAPQGGIPWSSVFSPSSLSYSPCWVRLAGPPAQLGYTGDTLVACFVLQEDAFVPPLPLMGPHPVLGMSYIKWASPPRFTGLRKDLLPQSTAAVGVTSPIPCFLQSCFSQGW